MMECGLVVPRIKGELEDLATEGGGGLAGWGPLVTGCEGGEGGEEDVVEEGWDI
jgi:hypothetical protein